MDPILACSKSLSIGLGFLLEEGGCNYRQINRVAKEVPGVRELMKISEIQWLTGSQDK